MRRIALGLALVITGCNGGNESSSPTTSPGTAAYCRLMERTDVVHRSAGMGDPALLRAKWERVDDAPPELQDEYAEFAKGTFPHSVTVRIQDWTQEHCGFLPSFG